MTVATLVMVMGACELAFGYGTYSKEIATVCAIQQNN